MPGMNGRALAEAALKLVPNLKVLYMTGYSRNAIVHHGRLDPGLLSFRSRSHKALWLCALSEVGGSGLAGRRAR